MAAAEIIAMGTGSLEKKDRDAVMRRWRKQVDQKARKTTTPQDMKSARALMGIAEKKNG